MGGPSMGVAGLENGPFLKPVGKHDLNTICAATGVLGHRSSLYPRRFRDVPTFKFRSSLAVRVYRAHAVAPRGKKIILVP